MPLLIGKGGCDKNVPEYQQIDLDKHQFEVHSPWTSLGILLLLSLPFLCFKKQTSQSLASSKWR